MEHHNYRSMSCACDNGDIIYKRQGKHQADDLTGQVDITSDHVYVFGACSCIFNKYVYVHCI